MTINANQIEYTVTNALRVAAEEYEKHAKELPEVSATFEQQANEARELMNEIEERGIKAVTARCPD